MSSLVLTPRVLRLQQTLHQCTQVQVCVLTCVCTHIYCVCTHIRVYVPTRNIYLHTCNMYVRMYIWAATVSTLQETLEESRHENRALTDQLAEQVRLR